MAERAKTPEQAAEAKRPRRLPPLETARGWAGLPIDGIGTRSLGRVAGLLVDVKDGDPRWVLIRLGPLAGCTAVPFEHVAEGGGRVWTAYERGSVRAAPRFRHDTALAASEEIELCAHWGVREERGRAGEVAGRHEDEITAIPDPV